MKANDNNIFFWEKMNAFWIVENANLLIKKSENEAVTVFGTQK